MPVVTIEAAADFFKKKRTSDRHQRFITFARMLKRSEILRPVRLLMLFTAVLYCCSDSRETRVQRFLLLGNEKMSEREYGQAERYYNEAIRLDSCYADAWNNLGTVYHRQGNLTKAEAYYSRALMCNPAFAISWLNRANVFYELDSLDLALNDLAAFEKQNSDTSAVDLLRGLVRWKRQDYQRALGNFKDVLAKEGDQKDILVNIGSLYISLGRYDSARSFLDRARAMDASFPEMLNAVALLEAEEGNTTAALDAVEAALAGKPEDPYFLNNKGYILLTADRPQEAIALIDKSISLDPYNSWAYRNKGIYNLKKGNFQEALRLFRRAEAEEPQAEKLLYWSGLAYLQTGEKQHGCEYLDKAVKAQQITAEEFRRLCK